jgi:hypothetical protein
MAWVRIDDRAMSHPKIVGLNDQAFRLWVWGLSYAQQHLTNGILTSEALPARLKRFATDLVAKRLWDAQATGGFQIHDFLEWNDSRDVVIQRKLAAEAERVTTRDRLSRWRAAKREKRTAQTITETPDETPLKRECNTVTAPFLKRSCNGLNQTEPNQTSTAAQQQPRGGGRKERPLFHNSRFAVHRWQVDELISMLGNQADSFDLDAWLLTGAVQRAQQEPGVIENWWAWLKAETVAEAKRRGLPFTSVASSARRDPDAEIREQADAALALLHKPRSL